MELSTTAKREFWLHAYFLMSVVYPAWVFFLNLDDFFTVKIGEYYKPTENVSGGVIAYDTYQLYIVLGMLAVWLSYVGARKFFPTSPKKIFELFAGQIASIVILWYAGGVSSFNQSTVVAGAIYLALNFIIFSLWYAWYFVVRDFRKNFAAAKKSVGSFIGNMVGLASLIGLVGVYFWYSSGFFYRIIHVIWQNRIDPLSGNAAVVAITGFLVSVATELFVVVRLFSGKDMNPVSSDVIN